MKPISEGEMLAQLHEASASPCGLCHREKTHTTPGNKEDVFFLEFDTWRYTKKYMVWVWAVRKQ